MHIYLCGPMTGIPDHNFPAFHAEAARLRALGYRVTNPAELDDGDTSKPWEYYLRRDLRMMLGCDAVAVLPGWQGSRGARLETSVAQAVGIPVLDADTLSPLRLSAAEEAKRLVHGDRQEAYSHPAIDYERTGRMWGAILGIADIDPRICCLMMACVKISREVNKHSFDNLVDLAGYAECAHLVAEYQAAHVTDQRGG